MSVRGGTEEKERGGCLVWLSLRNEEWCTRGWASAEGELGRSPAGDVWLQALPPPWADEGSEWVGRPQAEGGDWVLE